MAKPSKSDGLHCNHCLIHVDNTAKSRAVALEDTFAESDLWIVSCDFCPQCDTHECYLCDEKFRR